MAKKHKGKGHGRKGSKAIPAVQAMVIGYPIYHAYKTNGFHEGMLIDSVYDLTGYSVTEKKWADPAKGVGLGVGLFLMSTVGSKIASRVGANRMLKKLTAGYVKLM